ncbi:DUF3352 domain-containing protein [Microcoleus sp. FACHB-831]|uniref:DUF3352 domain-containing protein n=1 Tax=Microcoleus sp. FACHB-831 TaxID=2692827 RepID=UPI001689AC3F|nr:DUF3352 domain-containing protein [Microcoleus sp. FACHB-831]MBD1923248.1 DUF3352 domain-containing protein [Microcoleus sp. FACHB-831]
MKRSSFFYALAAGVVVLLLISAGGFYWLTNRSPLNLLGGGETATPEAAMFVPSQAPAMVSLLVNPDRLDGFEKIVASLGEGKRSRLDLDELKQNLLANTGVDYQRDIQPWLGDEITLAVTTLDFDREAQNGKQPGYLLAATTKDPEKSKEFVQLFWQKQSELETDLVFEQYQGVKLIYKNQTSEKKKSVASAVVGDRFVLFANDPKVLRDAINNVQAPTLSLSNSSSYQLALQSITQPRIALSFVNLPALTERIGNNSASLAPKGYESLAIALSLNNQGILAETALLGGSNEKITATTPTLSQPVAALQYIPQTSGFVAASTNLNQLWDRLQPALSGDNTLSQFLNQSIASLQDRWGIQLPADIFSWVEGEYALALLPRPDRNYPDWIFVAEKSDKAESGIEHLDAVAKQRGFSIGSLPLEDRDISAWTKLTTATATKEGKQNGPVVLNAQVQGVHATAGKYEIFTTSIEAMDRALKASSDPLVVSGNFKDAIAPFTTPNNGYLYVDWAASQSLLERQVPILPFVELVGKPLFDNLRSLSLTSQGASDGVQRSQIFFRLGKNKD